MEYIGAAFAIISALIGLGAGWELNGRKKNLNEQGQNDITETDCELLCEQLRKRWNELCLALADVEYLRERWESAAKLAAGLTAAGLALQYAAQAALSSFFGAFAAPALFIAAAAFFAAAIIEAGYASSAKTGFDKASTVANSARIAFLAAETQMQNNCTSEQNKACKDLLVECP